MRNEGLVVFLWQGFFGGVGRALSIFVFWLSLRVLLWKFETEFVLA